MPTDAIIIGGGAAGLAAAQRLAAAGVKVQVLEARPRLGGRIHTIRDLSLPVPLEGGAEFLHGKPPETWKICMASRLVICDVPNTRRHLIRGKLQDRPDFWTRVERVMGRLGGFDKDMTFSRFLSTRCRNVSAQDRALALSYVEGFNAADGKRISCRSLVKASAAEEEIEGDRQFRVASGYDSVIAALAGLASAQSGRTHLNTLVREICWKRQADKVEILAQHTGTGAPARFHADRVLVTLPLAVLQSRSVRFRPALPRKQQAADRLAMGNVVKAILIFREPFWEGSLPSAGKTDTSNTAFFHGTDPRLTFPTWWTMLPVRTTALVGWAGGPPAEKLARLSERRILAAAFNSLARFTGMRETDLTALLQSSYILDWRRDPYAQGAYSYIPVGGLDAPAELARPEANRLFFAGEHTHDGMSGTVAGAIASGYRAAEQILGHV